jgi:hypothetical protein
MISKRERNIFQVSRGFGVEARHMLVSRGSRPPENVRIKTAGQILRDVSGRTIWLILTGLDCLTCCQSVVDHHRGIQGHVGESTGAVANYPSDASLGSNRKCTEQAQSAWCSSGCSTFAELKHNSFCLKRRKERI